MNKECNRPRRPNPETITYLKSLPLDAQVATDEVERFLSFAGRTNGGERPVERSEEEQEQEQEEEEEEDGEFPQSFAAALSAIDEIRNEIASLAGDEHGAQVVEALARIACPYSEKAARTLLSGTRGYYLHMATHRYGSHVLQTLLQLSVAERGSVGASAAGAAAAGAAAAAAADLALHEDAPPLKDGGEDGPLPSLAELVAGVQEELMPRATDLAVHVCGSHVLRTLACVLAGVRSAQGADQVDEGTGRSVRRFKGGNKNKKKKKRKQPHPDQDSNNFNKSGSSDVVYEPNSRLCVTDPAIQRAMADLVEALIGGTQVQPPGELQELVCHTSAGPLLIVLLRALTYRDAPKDWQQQQRHQRSGGMEVGGGITGGGGAADHHLSKFQPEPQFGAGSDAHRMATRILCWKDQEEDQQQQGKWASEVVYRLAGESHGSHVLEVLLRLSPDDLHASIVKAGGFSSKSALKEYAEHDIGNFAVQAVLATTRSPQQFREILAALEPRIKDGSVTDSSTKRRGILWRVAEAATEHKVCQKELLAQILDGFKAWQGEKQCSGLADCVPLLLNVRTPEQQHGGRLGLDAPGARTLYYLLRFEPGFCKDILKGIVRLPLSDLELLAKDGLGSRCVWDGVLESPSMDDPVFASAIKKLFSKLQGRWVALASDRIGHHSAKKIFRALKDPNDKKQLVAELAEGKSRLNGCAMGRNVMEACCVQVYAEEGESAWSKAVAKMQQKAEWLKEIEEEKLLHSATAKQTKKRKSDKKSGDSKKEEKKKKSKTTVESIMETLTMPSHDMKSRR